ncbi:MAG: DUF3784 domain-containing protein [Rikenellaceae bacterium]|nr:DUF3784 domain-containing protein [Rikenellaceae bacterium]
MVGYIHIGEIIVLIGYGLIFLGVGVLARKYPETISGISTMSKEKRDKLNLKKIGAFVSKWLNVSATVVFLAILIPKPDLRWQVACLVPVFLILLASAYLIKYKNTRFKKEE